MKQTKTGTVNRSIRAGGKLVLVAGAALLMAVACGGEDDGDGGDGDGDGDVTGSGGMSTGSGGSGSGGLSGGTGGIIGGSGGSTPLVVPTTPGTAPATAIPAGDFTITEDGFGSDAVSGFSGFAYSYVDTGGSVLYPSTFSMVGAEEIAEGKICSNGTAAQVVNMMWDTIYGGGIGWNLGQAAPTDDEPEPMPSPVDVSAYPSVTFTLHAETTATMRFQANVGMTSYCTTITAGENTIDWTTLNSTCWDGLGENLDPATQMVDSIAWQVVATDASDSPFDFCVGGITFGDGGGMGGAPAQ